MAESNEYLQPGFNPSTYKVSQLRNVLLQNDITYPTHAKKQDLINLFNAHIKPIASNKLKVLDNVVANDNGIEVVKRKKKIFEDDDSNETSESSKLKTRRSPRKLSGSSKFKDEEAQRAPTKEISGSRSSSIGKIPDLQASIAAKTRGTSPARKSSTSKETDDIRRDRLKKNSSRSKATEDDSNRDISPSRRVAKLKKDLRKRERSPSKRTYSRKLEKAVELEPAESAHVNSDVDIEESKPSFKLDKTEPNLDTSFSNDNVFQSSPPTRVIPKKRGAEEDDRSPRKITKTKRKTAFSSSPEPQPRIKSPPKKALEILKFEKESAASTQIQNNGVNIDLFGDADKTLDDDFVNSATHRATKREIETSNEEISKSDDQTLKLETESPFQTPDAGDVSRFTDTSSSPVKRNILANPKSPVKRSSMTPDFSKFNVSSGFASKLRNIQNEKPTITPLTSEEGNEGEEDREVLQEDDIFESDNDDSTLTFLKKDIDSANVALLEEAKEAVKQINKIFDDEFVEHQQTDDIYQQEASSVVDKTDELNTKRVSYRSLFTFLKQTLIFFFFVSITFMALWYREQRILIGYCGSEIDHPTFPNTENQYLLKFDEFLQTVKPDCANCPENAICLPSFQIKCKQDFIVYQPWYKLHGIVPFSDYCVEDREKEDIINEVVLKSLDLLRTRNANFKCGDGEDLEVGISDEELHEFFFTSKNPSVSDEEFEELWLRVLKDLESEPEITLRFEKSHNSGFTSNNISANETEKETDISKQKIVFRSNSHVKLSISCKFKKEIYERFEQNKLYIIIGSSVLVLMSYLRYQIRLLRQRQLKIREVSGDIIKKLQKQTKVSINDPTGLTNRYLSAIQLRDELLNNYRNHKDKLGLWKLIINHLEKNGNIRSSTKEIHGEIVKVLEWIGEFN